MTGADKAIHTKLAGDATLTALLSAPDAVFKGVADSDTEFPYVIFNYQGGVKQFTHAAKAWDNALYLVKAVDKSGSGKVAEGIAARLEALLTDAALTITGRTVMSMRPQSDVDYPEVTTGQKVWHRGAVWRLYVS